MDGLGYLDLDTTGSSLNQALLSKVVGIMMGGDKDPYEPTTKKFNFMTLKSDFPELYDALAWAFKNNHLSVSGEMTHMSIDKDTYTLSEIKNMLDMEGSSSGRTPAYDLFRGLLATYDPDDLSTNLTPTMSYKLQIGETIKEVIDPDLLEVIMKIEKDLGGLPGGSVHGGISLRNSTFSNPLGDLDDYKSILGVLFRNIFQMTDEQIARLPSIPDDELRSIADLLDIPLDNMMHIDWDFMQVASADGFVSFLNDPGVTGQAQISKLKRTSLVPLMRLVKDFMGHFKTHNIPIESTASKSLRHLMNIYQELGAIIIEDYPAFKKTYQGASTGSDTSAILILPEYMLNDEIEKQIVRPGEKNPIWQQGLRQLTEDFKYIDSNGEPQIIRKGEILLDSQFKKLKDMAKRMNIELPQSPIDRRRNANKQGNVPEVNLSYSRGAIRERFGSGTAERLIKITNLLDRAEVLDIEQPALGYELNEFTYLDWNEAPRNGKPSIYTDFFTKVRLALRAKGTENLFLRQLVAALFGGEFIDAEQRLLAVPIVDQAGFSIINFNQLTEDDMLNLAYIKSGNKNFTPDIFFGGSIGKINYTPELVEGFRNILYTEDLLEFFSNNVAKIVSTPPPGITAEGSNLTASTVYTIQEMFEKSPKTFLRLYNSYKGTPGEQIFDILPDNILVNLERLVSRMASDGIAIDDLPDVDTEGNAVNYKTLLEGNINDAYENILESLNKELKDLETGETTIEDLPEDTQSRIRARQERVLNRANLARARATGASVDPNTILVNLIRDENTSIYYNDTTRLGRNITDAAFGVDDLAKFFNLTDYDDYELAVTGLAQGPSHMDGRDINETKSIIANLINGNPTVYGNYSFKFLERMDGTTAIAFLNENAKDVFKKNLLVANRIYGVHPSTVSASIQGYNIAESTEFLDRATISPNTKILYFDAAPVQTNAVFKNKIHMLEFDVGIAERLGNGKEIIHRVYTQIGYEFDEDTGKLIVHHYVDNIPNDQNQLAGNVVRNQGNLPKVYAIKDSAIIKSIMDLHGVTDETLVVDGDGFLPLSKGTRRLGDTVYDTLSVVPGRIAHAFGLVGTEDPDPDSDMYTKTLSESKAPLLRSRKIATLWGMFQDFTIGTVVEEFNSTESLLSDTDVRLQPVINNPNFYITKIIPQFRIEDDFINKAATLFEPFGMKQDNLSGFTISNVELKFVSESGEIIKVTGDLNQDLVLTRVSHFDSDNLDSLQVQNVVEATIKKNYPNFNELSDVEQNVLKNSHYLTFLELDTTTGKYTLSSLGDSGDVVGEFKISEIVFKDSSLQAYADTETALEINEAFKELNINFSSEGTNHVHTYNPFVTEIIESNSYMGSGDTSSNLRSGVETATTSEFDDLFKIYANTIYGFKSETLYPLRGRYPAPLRNINVINNFSNLNETPDIVSTPEYTDGITRHSPVTSDLIARAAGLSGSAIKATLKPVGSAFKLLEKFDVADKIVMKSIKPVASILAKGLGLGGLALGGGTIAAGLATVYAAQELYLLAHGLIKEGDLFSDTQKLMKELRDDNPGDGAWKRFWVSTGKNAWKGLEWQQDHSLSGWIEEQLISGAGQAISKFKDSGITFGNNNNYNYIREVASFAEKNESIFDNVNKYDPQYDQDFDNINQHMNLAMEKYGTEEHKSRLNSEINNITKYGVWKNTEDLLYNGNEEFLATVDNYIKIAKAYESIGY